MLRVTIELLWAIRREGVVIPPAAAIDVVRAVSIVGFDSRDVLYATFCSLLAKSVSERDRIERALDGYFFDRESNTFDPELEHLLQTNLHVLEGLTDPAQVGFFTHRMLDQIGTVAEADVRSFVARKAEATVRREVALDALPPDEAERVHRAVRGFASKLRGRERVRQRRALRGAIDPHRTLRRALSTFGVPIAALRQSKRPDKPRLVILCDMSDSVRRTSSFFLELVHSAHDLFKRTRSFLFVSDVVEVTALFERSPLETAMREAPSAIQVTDNSNYGRAFALFEERFADAIDRRTTIVILGDGRSNYHDPRPDVLARLRRRARAILWLCPEPRASWVRGDSALPVYRDHTNQIFEVLTARDLEMAATLIASLRR